MFVDALKIEKLSFLKKNRSPVRDFKHLLKYHLAVRVNLI